MNILLKLDHWFRRRCQLKDSYLELWQPSCSAEPNHLCNFGRGHYGEHSFEIINLDQRFRRCRLKKKLHTPDDGQRPITKAHLEPFAQVS